jgi:hypothetical protein
LTLQHTDKLIPQIAQRFTQPEKFMTRHRAAIERRFADLVLRELIQLTKCFHAGPLRRKTFRQRSDRRGISEK